MTDFVTFLRARLDEDEWRANVGKEAAAKRTHYRADMLRTSERNLRDVAAKRAIVDLHVDRAECTRCERFDDELYPCDTLKLLASTYTDHPGYQQEWTP